MVVETDNELDLDAVKALLEKDQTAWSEVYRRAREDLYFVSDHEMAQWDQLEYQARINTNRPALTLDQLGQFLHQVANDIRMNTPNINVIAGEDGDQETAQIIKGWMKNVEYRSNADEAYDTAADFAIKSSLGFLRVDHDYTNPAGFEQDLFIKRCVNPQAIIIDSDSTECDGSDAKHGFVLDKMRVSEFKKQYPGKAVVSFEFGIPATRTYNDDDHIFIVEFFQIKEETRRMAMTDDGVLTEYQEGQQYARDRIVSKRKVMRYKLSGADVLEKTTFPGKYIPIVPVYGEEAWENGERRILSLIRKAKGAQRMYNYMASLETEWLMKQPIAPILAPVGATENFAADYINPEKTMVLRYNQENAAGMKLDRPERLQPISVPSGLINARREALEDIKAAMGLYNASIGARGNETSGVAIKERQQEGDVATFHFGDNLRRSITQVGRILESARSTIHDTPRVIRILDDEDNAKSIGINGKRVEDQERDHMFTDGEYDIKVTTGAPFTTLRQEGAAALTEIITASPELMNVAGDLLFKNMDFPGAQALASRMKKLIDPKLLDDEEKEEIQAVDPEKMQMQAMIQELQKQLELAQSEKAYKMKDLEIKQEEVGVKRAEVGIKEQDMKLKYITALKPEPANTNVPNTAQPSAAPQSPQPMPSNDDSIEVLQLKLQQKIIQQQQEAEQAMMMQQQMQTEEQIEAEQEAQELAMKQQELQIQAVQAEALTSLSQQVGQLVNGVQQVKEIMSAPINVVRDSNGVITGAV